MAASVWESRPRRFWTGWYPSIYTSGWWNNQIMNGKCHLRWLKYISYQSRCILASLITPEQFPNCHTLITRQTSPKHHPASQGLLRDIQSVKFLNQLAMTEPLCRWLVPSWQFAVLDHHWTIRTQMDCSCCRQRLYSFGGASKWNEWMAIKYAAGCSTQRLISWWALVYFPTGFRKEHAQKSWKPS